jgi:hypothetical protein
VIVPLSIPTTHEEEEGMRFRKTAALVAMVMALGALETGTALAKDSTDSGQPATKVVRENFTQSQSATTAAGYTGTWEYNVYVSRTTLGITDWTYRHKVIWTGNNTTISSYSPSDSSTYITPGFSFTNTADGPTSTYTSGGKTHKRKQTNGKYKYCVIVCIFENNPYVDTTVRADGGHWTNAASIG